MVTKTLYLIRENGAVILYSENEGEAKQKIKDLAAEREKTLKGDKTKASVEGGESEVKVLTQSLGLWNGSVVVDTIYDILTVKDVNAVIAAAA